MLGGMSWGLRGCISAGVRRGGGGAAGCFPLGDSPPVVFGVWSGCCVDFGVDAVGEGFSPDACEAVVCCEEGHVGACCDGCAADVGDEDDVCECEEGVVHGEWFCFEDVEPGGGDGFVAQCVVEGFLVYDGAACGVDEDGGGFHFGELRCADEVFCVFVEGAVYGDEIGFGEEFVHAAVLCCELVFEFGAAVSVVVEDAHLESCGASCDFCSDASCSDEADCGVVYVDSDEEVW